MPSSEVIAPTAERHALLAAALLLPLPVLPWLPPWESELYAHGMLIAAALCIAYAAIEEVIFRGGIQSWLLAKTKLRRPICRISLANWLTSILFALAHLWQHPYWLLPGYLGVSLLFGHFRERYQGIRIPLALHAWYNLLLLFMPRLG